MVACHRGAGPALHRVCLVNCVWPGSSNWLIPAELWTQRGGAAIYRNIISHEYASILLLRWSRDFRGKECWITHQFYLKKSAVSWSTWRKMWPCPTLSCNWNVLYRHGLFITAECTCISSFWCDGLILLWKSSPYPANKRVIPVDMFPSVSHFDHPKYMRV